MNRAVILFTLACIAAGAFAADKQQVYKWTDANGVVHFSDAPPPSDTKNVQSVRLVGGTSAETPAADANAAPADDKTKPATAVAADSADSRAKDCEQAKRNLALLQSNYSVSELGPDGKVKPIDDKERAGRIAGVNERIAQVCAK